MYTFIFRVACWIEKESTSLIASIIFFATVRSNGLSPGLESILLLPLPSCSSPPCYEFFFVCFFFCLFFLLLSSWSSNGGHIKGKIYCIYFYINALLSQDVSFENKFRNIYLRSNNLKTRNSIISRNDFCTHNFSSMLFSFIFGIYVWFGEGWIQIEYSLCSIVLPCAVSCHTELLKNSDYFVVCWQEFFLYYLLHNYSILYMINK